MSVIRVLGRLANDRGWQNEDRALRATRDLQPCWPGWLHSLRLATPDEDARGWDLVAETDVGKVGVQVKSSASGLRQHHARHPGVPGVLSTRSVKSTELGLRILAAVRLARTRIIAIRRYRRYEP